MIKNKFSGILIVLGFFLSACTAANAASQSPSATEESIVTEAVSTLAPEAGECLACHTDKQRLIDTAEHVEEIAEAESKGVG